MLERRRKVDMRVCDVHRLEPALGWGVGEFTVELFLLLRNRPVGSISKNCVQDLFGCDADTRIPILWLVKGRESNTYIEFDSKGPGK